MKKTNTQQSSENSAGLPHVERQAPESQLPVGLTESLEEDPLRKSFTRASQIEGAMFVRLKAISAHSKTKSGNVVWECVCSCGTRCYASATRLITGRKQSCGCLQKERQRAGVTTHGLSYSRTYRSWTSMISRCHNPKSTSYESYGGRGILVCDQWRFSFEAFMSDMGARPDGHSLGRLDGNLGYCPSNCRWESAMQQSHNRRNTVFLTIGAETLPLSVAARKYGVHASCISKRIKRGMTAKMAADKTFKAVRWSKLNESQVRAIITKRRNGERVKAIAAAFGITGHTVAHICSGKTWSHLWEGSKLKDIATAAHSLEEAIAILNTP